VARDPGGAEREARALEQRRRGLTYEAIGASLGVSRQRAHALVQKAIARVELPLVADVRRLEVDRLDAMLDRAWQMYLDDHPFVAQGAILDGVFDARTNMAAGQLLLRISERRAKLLGADAPIQVSGPDGGPVEIAVDARAELSERIAAMTARLAGTAAFAPPRPAEEDEEAPPA